MRAANTWARQSQLSKPAKYRPSDITIIRRGGELIVRENPKPLQVKDEGRKIGYKRVKRDQFGNRLDTLDGKADSFYQNAPRQLHDVLATMGRLERRKFIIEQGYVG
tara:strand:- start:178 stop:498 length:321 start_codon:yes stop_codon:yes gene_type:complete